MRARRIEQVEADHVLGLREIDQPRFHAALNACEARSTTPVPFRNLVNAMNANMTLHGNLRNLVISPAEREQLASTLDQFGIQRNDGTPLNNLERTDFINALVQNLENLTVAPANLQDALERIYVGILSSNPELRISEANRDINSFDDALTGISTGNRDKLLDALGETGSVEDSAYTNAIVKVLSRHTDNSALETVASELDDTDVAALDAANAALPNLNTKSVDDLFHTQGQIDSLIRTHSLVGGFGNRMTALEAEIERIENRLKPGESNPAVERQIDVDKKTLAALQAQPTPDAGAIATVTRRINRYETVLRDDRNDLRRDLTRNKGELRQYKKLQKLTADYKNQLEAYVKAAIDVKNYNNTAVLPRLSVTQLQTTLTQVERFNPESDTADLADILGAPRAILGFGTARAASLFIDDVTIQRMTKEMTIQKRRAEKAEDLSQQELLVRVLIQTIRDADPEITIDEARHAATRIAANLVATEVALADMPDLQNLTSLEEALENSELNVANELFSLSQQVTATGEGDDAKTERVFAGVNISSVEHIQAAIAGNQLNLFQAATLLSSLNHIFRDGENTSLQRSLFQYLKSRLTEDLELTDAQIANPEVQKLINRRVHDMIDAAESNQATINENSEGMDDYIQGRYTYYERRKVILRKQRNNGDLDETQHEAAKRELIAEAEQEGLDPEEVFRSWTGLGTWTTEGKKRARLYKATGAAFGKIGYGIGEGFKAVGKNVHKIAGGMALSLGATGVRTVEAAGRTAWATAKATKTGLGAGLKRIGNKLTPAAQSKQINLDIKGAIKGGLSGSAKMAGKIGKAYLQPKYSTKVVGAGIKNSYKTSTDARARDIKTLEAQNQELEKTNRLSALTVGDAFNIAPLKAQITQLAA
jgi:hypothetical protein